AGDRDKVDALPEHPRYRELGGGNPLVLRDLLDLGGECLVCLQVRAREARRVAAKVPLIELVRRLEPAGEEAPPERRVGHKADPELAAGGQHFRFRVAAPQRVLGLEGGDGMDRVGTTDRLRGGLAEPEVKDLARADELGHRADSLLDRYAGV